MKQGSRRPSHDILSDVQRQLSLTTLMGPPMIAVMEPPRGGPETGLGPWV